MAQPPLYCHHRLGNRAGDDPYDDAFSPAARSGARACSGRCRPGSRAQEVAPAHGVAMYGDLKYGPDFEHFDYVNPNAPKGGTVTFSAVGTLRQLQSLHHQGARRRPGSRLLFESLTTQSQDEPFSEYGLLAESIEMPEDRSWVAFTLQARGALARRQAGHGRGRDLEPRDAAGQGRALLSVLLQEREVGRAGGRTPRQVHLRSDHQSRAAADHRPAADPAQALLREAASSTGRRWSRRSAAGLIGSSRSSRAGPSSTSGWRTTGAPILPVNRGSNNFDKVRYEYYRDANVALEAFKAGAYDFRLENTSKFWATAYTGPMFDAGWIRRRRSRTSSAPACRGSRSTRGARCSRIRGCARRWPMRSTSSGPIAPSCTASTSARESYFSNTELAPGPAERGRARRCSSRFATSCPRRCSRRFTKRRRPKARAASGKICARRWPAARGRLEVEGGSLVNAEGQPFRFEILLNGPSFERNTLPFVQNLERLGIEARCAPSIRRSTRSAWTRSTST